MTPKDRVLTTLDHREPDRVPIDLGATMETTVHIDEYRLLKEHLGIATERDVGVKHLTAQFAVIDPEVQEAIGADVRGTEPITPTSPEIGRRDQYLVLEDEFGIGWQRPIDGGLYFDMYFHPLADASIEDMRAYRFPDPCDPRRFEGLEQTVEALSQAGRYPVVFDNSLGNGIFQMCNQLMGYDRFLMALALREDRAFWLLDRILEMKLALWDEVLTRVGSQLNVVKELDDMGTQLDLFISPEMYRSDVKPRLSKLVSLIKSKAPNVRMMLHSCGAVRKVIGDFVDAGVEILNPVQYTAAGMDPVELKAEFGADLTFWGGGIETQKTLPAGAVRDVVAETRKQLDILMPGGGFVFSPVHTIQWGVPVENVIAMWDTVREYGVYR